MQPNSTGQHQQPYLQPIASRIELHISQDVVAMATAEDSITLWKPLWQQQKATKKWIDAGNAYNPCTNFSFQFL